MYLSDVCTVPSNLAGHPAMSVPFGADEQGLPIGVQVLAPALGRRSCSRWPLRSKTPRRRLSPGQCRALVARGHRGGPTKSSAEQSTEQTGVGAGHRARGALRAADGDEALLRLPQRFRRRAQHQRLPRVPRAPRVAAGAQRQGGRVRHAHRHGAAAARSGRRCSTARTTSIPTCRRTIRSASTTSRSTSTGSWSSPTGAGSGSMRAHMEEDTGKTTHIGGGGRIHDADALRSSTTTAPASRSSRSCPSPTSRSAAQARAYVGRAAGDPRRHRVPPTAGWRKARCGSTPTSRCGRPGRARSGPAVRSRT